MNVFFICGRNRRRSPTAEEIFADYPGVETASAGVSADADEPVTADVLEWAQLIVVMENSHRGKLNAKFSSHLRDKRIACINVPDKYEYMDARLIELLKERVPPLLTRSR